MPDIRNMGIKLWPFFLSFIFFSCNKGTTVQTTNQYGLAGTWELRHVELIPGSSPDYPPGNGDQFTFISSNYIYREKGIVEGTGTFSISPQSGNPQLIMNGIFAGQTIGFNIKNDTLTLYYGLPSIDEEVAVYVKL